MSYSNGPRIITDGLVLYLDAGNSKSYPGSGTTWTNLISNEYDVILQNGPVFNTNYFSFDGINDRGYIKTLNYGGGNTISEMSVFAWIRTSYNGGTPSIWNQNNWSLLDFDRSEVFTFALNGTGELQMSGRSSNTGGIGSGYYDILGNLRNNDGNWHYVGWTFSVANQKIIMYVDGQVDKTFTANGGMTALGYGVTRYGLIGDGSEATYEGGAGNDIFYEGDIASLSFYDGKSLTLSEILQNYNALKGRFNL